MNHVYRVIWNIALGAWQAVSEVSTGAGKVKSQRRRQRTTAAGALLIVSAQLCAADLPQGGVVAAGSGSIAQPNAQTLNVTQSSNRMAVDWQSFSVGQGKTVNFIQPGSSAVVLNRVIGNNVSSIQGAIKANGQVFLINPNGVIFSPTAQVNVGSLIASTRNITNEQFNAGNYRFEGSSNSAILNQGNITTADGGYVVLIAARIENIGSVNASKGFVGMASGNVVTVDMGGPVKLQVEQGAIESLISNGGILMSEGGQVLLTAKAAGELAASVVNNAGIIEASSVNASGGKIVLLGDSLRNSGSLAANGATGGGEILVGGDWQGSNANLYPHASRVTLTETSDISAQATQQGNGGKIVLWSGMNKIDGITAVSGRLNAESRGSHTAGGKIETSGKALAISESTEVKTKGGEWLLDPVNIAIDSTLAGSISTALGSGNVTISTSGSNTPSTATGESGTDGDIAVNGSITKISGSDSTLTFKAHRNITLASGVTVSSTSNKLNLVLWANQDGVGDGRIEVGNSGSTLTNITTNGGGVWMGGGSGSTSWTPFSGATAITVGDGYALSSSGSTLSSNQSNGISLLATRITTAGGNVALYGDSESSVQVNDGIRMQYDAVATSATQIDAGAGKIYVDGKTASGGTFNFGLDIKNATLTSTSNAADAVTLKGSSNTTGNDTAIVAGNTTINASQGGVALNLNTQSASDSAWDPGANSTITAKDLTITSSGKLRLGSASDNKTTMVVSGTTTVNAQNGINIEMGSASNQLGTLQISGSLAQASVVNSNALTLNGISGATGALSVETLSGNLTLAGNVSTTSTATNAIVLNAGKNTAAGTSTGGDIIVSGSPTLSTGSGGRATLYTGSVAGSTGLTNLIGSGTGRFRYNSDESASNFSAALAAGKYAIYRERPTVTVNVDNQSKTYDGLAYTGSNSATATGFVNGDSATNLTAGLSYTINSGNLAKNAGSYAIAASGTSDVGYNLAYNNGSLTINKAALTVTADNKTKTYGDANPTLTSTLTGFKNGETAANAGVTGNAALSTAATQTTGAGTAAITAAAGTLAANNYTFTNLNNGTLTINKAALTVTADNKTKTYGDANPTLSSTLTGFKNGETAANAGVTGNAALSTAATQTTGAGTAAITAAAGTLAANNYTFTNLNNGTLTINKAALTVTADNKTKTYGDANPTLTSTLTGFKNGETTATAGVTGAASLSTTATQTTGAGTAAITAAAGTLAANNYTFTNLVNGTLTIKAASTSATNPVSDTVNNAVNSVTAAKNPTTIKPTTTPLVSNTTTLLDLKLSLAELKKLGTTAELLKANGYSAKALSDAGYDLKQLKEGGYSLADLKALGITEPIGPWAWPSDMAPLRKAGFTAIELKKSGAGFMDLSVGGYSNEELAAIFSVRELADINKSSPPLKYILSLGYKASDFRDAGYTAADLKSNGADLASLVKSGFTVGELKSAGYTAKELSDAGYDLKQLKEGGYSLADLKALGITEPIAIGSWRLPSVTAPLIKAGFTAKELKDSGVSYMQFVIGGYSKEERKALFTIQELKNDKELQKTFNLPAAYVSWGYSSKELTDNGYSIEILKSAGVKPKELVEAGFSVQELIDAGLSLASLKDAGIEVSAYAQGTPKDLLAKGYKLSDLITLGFTAKDLNDAGYSLDYLAKNGGKPGDFKLLGFGVAELKKYGYSASEFKNAGFSAADLKNSNYKLADLDGIFSLGELKNGGFSGKDYADSFGLASGFQWGKSWAVTSAISSISNNKLNGKTAFEFKLNGFSAKDVIDMGFQMKDLKDAGYTAKEAADGGFYSKEYLENYALGHDSSSINDVALNIKYSYGAGYFKAVGLDIKDAINLGGTDAYVKYGGYTASEFKSIGKTASDLKALGFTDKEIKDAGL